MEARSGKVWRIGFMTNGVRGPDFDGLRDGFAALGYAEGRNIIFEPRFAEHQLERHPSFADELVRLDVDLILTFGGPATFAAKKPPQTFPSYSSLWPIRSPSGSPLPWSDRGRTPRASRTTTRTR